MAISRFATLSEVTLHYREAGEGEVLVLLHDCPQTSHAWRHVMPRLASQVRVIAPDLRGLGDSSRPLDGFDIGTLAGDILELLDRLGVPEFSVAGHGHGGAVGVAMACLARNRINRLALIDAVLPGQSRSESARWHEDFHRVPNLPEALTAGREAIYLGWLYEALSLRGGAVGPDDLVEYTRCYQQPGSMRCCFDYDRSHDVSAAFLRTHLEWDGRLALPVLSVAGGAAPGRAGDAEDSIGRIASDVRPHIIPDCGHLIPEEAAEEISELLSAFLFASR
ncbi:alpha/beta hydrolase [Novosphingobium sp.]|uniref:alpha/beta fold hydrolase n=1 Tax=Novosphingobium sp. TaxID=1874826 RepID=UPI0031DC1824